MAIASGSVSRDLTSWPLKVAPQRSLHCGGCGFQDVFNTWVLTKSPIHTPSLVHWRKCTKKWCQASLPSGRGWKTQRPLSDTQALQPCTTPPRRAMSSWFACFWTEVKTRSAYINERKKKRKDTCNAFFMFVFFVIFLSKRMKTRSIVSLDCEMNEVDGHNTGNIPPTKKSLCSDQLGASEQCGQSLKLPRSNPFSSQVPTSKRRTTANVWCPEWECRSAAGWVMWGVRTSKRIGQLSCLARNVYFFPLLTCSGGTPLHLAASNDHAEVVRVLLDSGADVKAKDSQGHMAAGPPRPGQQLHLNRWVVFRWFEGVLLMGRGFFRR